MSVDTRNKRFSLMSYGLWNGRVLPNPSGSFDTAAERTQLELMYAFSAAAPVIDAPDIIRVTGIYQPTLRIIGRFDG